MIARIGEPSKATGGYAPDAPGIEKIPRRTRLGRCRLGW